MGSESSFTPEGSVNIFSFVTPSKQQKVSYKDCKRQLVYALRKNSNFEHGILLDTMEKGVWYPIVHCAGFAPEASLSKRNLLACNSLGGEFVLQQGVYREIRAIPSLDDEDSEILCLTPPPQLRMRNDSPVQRDSSVHYMFLGFKGLNSGLQDVLEDTWKDWTGARYIYFHLPEKFGLSRIAFYRRIFPNDVTLFSYILLVECSTITAENQVSLLDFVQRFRAQRGQGFLSVYRETRLGSTSSVDSALDYSSFASGSDVGSDDCIVSNYSA